MTENSTIKSLLEGGG